MSKPRWTCAKCDTSNSYWTQKCSGCDITYARQKKALDQTSSVPAERVVIRKNLDRFKIEEFLCGSWTVVPPVEKYLQELCKKHNDLIEYLSKDT